MSFVRCQCGCEVFTQQQAIKVDEGDFTVYNTASFKVAVKTVSFLRCIACDSIMPPNVTFPGKNRIDPEVAAYQEVYDAVSKRSKNV